MISEASFSGEKIKFKGERPKGMLKKIFVRNSEGHAYCGYLKTNDLPNVLAKLESIKQNFGKLEEIDMNEVQAFPSADCRISSVFIGSRRFPSGGQYVLITISTDENSSFDTAVSYEELCDFFKIKAKKS